MYKFSTFIKVIDLRFSNKGRDSVQEEGFGLENKKQDLRLGP